MKVSHAVMFCFAASAILVTMYLFLDYVLDVFSIFVTFSCTLYSGIVIHELLSGFIFNYDINRINALRRMGPEWFQFNWLEALSFLLAATISVGWYLTKNWMLNNLLGVSMCFIPLKTIRLNKLLPGVVLLTLLFFYDVFWVFYSSKFTKDG